MSGTPYQWRQLTKDERDAVLCSRRRKGYPWHGPQHRPGRGRQRYHLTAACYEHAAFIGVSPERMDAFSGELLAVLEDCRVSVYAWSVLPNHYHLLIETSQVPGLLESLGRFHGRTSFRWNGEERMRGRKVFHRAVEREIRSDRHFWCTFNYVLNNPVRHGYVERWSEWPWSSGRDYLKAVGREKAAAIWRAYPVLNYGAGWDDPEL